MPAGRNIPIPVATSLDDVESMDRGYLVGATDYIAKLISWPVLPHRRRYILPACLLGEAQRIAGLGIFRWISSRSNAHRSIAHIWDGQHCRYAFRDNSASARLVCRTADADPGCPQRASWSKDRAGPSNYHAPREERTLIEQKPLGPISQRKYIEFAGNIRSAGGLLVFSSMCRQRSSWRRGDAS